VRFARSPAPERNLLAHSSSRRYAAPPTRPTLMSDSKKTISYLFKLKSGEEKHFSLEFQFPSMQLISPKRAEYPAWAALEFNRCPHCPLAPEKNPQCPIAANLVDVIDFFKNFISTEMVEITITSENRQYHKRVPVQVSVSSLMGLHMVTSGCPIMDKLRPMVYTHLPFATVEETLYRAISMYLVAQFLLHKRGEAPDWELKNLVKIYDDIGRLNQTFVKRLISINPKDASLNALVSLDCFASYNTMSISENYLEELEVLFGSYIPFPA
jgi:hypothetical protein